jgi:stage V sporulation protein R
MVDEAHKLKEKNNKNWLNYPEFTKDQKVKYHMNGMVNWLPVEKIENTTVDLYDFVVPKNTSFISNGFINHNCTHVKIMDQLFREGLLNNDEHGQYNYSNSLVRAQNRHDINPYLVGSEIFLDIEERYNKGKHGKDYEECVKSFDKENWNTCENKGLEKCISVMETYTDWFFIHEFLTAELVDKLDLYLYASVEHDDYTDYVRTEHTAE